MKWRFLLPNFITAIALSTGFLSILLACNNHLELSAKLIFMTMILDGLDGNLARLVKGTSEFGAEFDTYVDIIAFAIAPAVILYKLSGQLYFSYKTELALLIVLMGTIRLARFKAQDAFRGQKGYKGLPITVGAGWIAAAAIAYEHQWMMNTDIEKIMATVFVPGLMVCLILQVSNLCYSKPTKHFPLLLLCAVLLLPFLFPNHVLAPKAALISIGLGALYVFLAPFLSQKIN